MFKANDVNARLLEKQKLIELLEKREALLDKSISSRQNKLDELIDKSEACMTVINSSVAEISALKLRLSETRESTEATIARYEQLQREADAAIYSILSERERLVQQTKEQVAQIEQQGVQLKIDLMKREEELVNAIHARSEELSHVTMQLHNVHRERDAASRDIAGLRVQIERCQQNLVSAQLNVEEKKQELAVLHQKVDALKITDSQIRDAREELRVLKGEIRAANDKLALIRNRCETELVDIDREHKKLDERESTVAQKELSVQSRLNAAAAKEKEIKYKVLQINKALDARNLAKQIGKVKDE